MKKIPVFLSFFCLIAISFSVNAQGTPNQLTDPSWYKMLTGKIGKYPITMHLHKAGHEYSGYYYYTSTQKPIFFSGDDTMYMGKIVVGCILGESLAETFDFTFMGDSATGTWTQNDSDKTLHFAAGVVRMPLDFSYVYTEGEQSLFSGLEGPALATFYASSVWPIGKTPENEIIKEAVREHFSKNAGTEEVGELLLKNKKEFLVRYLEENKTVSKADVEESPSMYNKSSSRHLFVMFQSKILLALAGGFYAYDGGAHGNYGTVYLVYDLQNSKKLALNDVVTEAGKKKLTELLEKRFRQRYELKLEESLEEWGLFVNKIEPNDNFYITDKGIGFVYNPYEIGSYAMGEIEFFIPFGEIINGLTPKIKMLVK